MEENEFQEGDQQHRMWQGSLERTGKQVSERSSLDTGRRLECDDGAGPALTGKEEDDLERVDDS